ncbi:MAG: beta-ketoacyl-ACP synthase II [Acidimicrobiia bacterium]|nr:beta-ketoacyl-ACP synthase II [Acidimicrobiia bacterium]NNF69685.1 beta-ketoacyl-ACP synthase II [Acidimicrobiia bacterium]
MRRVVVTGLGAVTPVGQGVDEVWGNLVSGVSGIGDITLFDASHLPATIAAEVTGFDPEVTIPRKEARRLDRNAQLFWVATGQALDDAGISYEEDDPAGNRAGVVVGSGIGGIQTFQDEIDVMRERGPGRVSPLAITKIISNMAGGVVSIAYHLYGPNTCTVTACAASANAIGDAAEIIKRGWADVMVAGGTEAGICEFAMAGFSQARALSTRNDDPEGASRPFDRGRDGFVMGEGAAALILEDYEHAAARGATIYAEVTGYGMSADGFHITLPRPGGTGAARAMVMALDSAGLDASDIGYINAHGTSTQANDVTETNAIKAAFGSSAQDLAISSTKSMTGHLLGGAGALEALVCIKAINEGVIPPTINLDDPDPECDLDYVPNTAREATFDHAMSNSFGFGGHNVALIFSRV